jgi:hypothetical protein
MHFLDVGRGVAVRRWKGVGYGSSYINRLDILIGYKAQRLDALPHAKSLRHMRILQSLMRNLGLLVSHFCLFCLVAITILSCQSERTQEADKNHPDSAFAEVDTSFKKLTFQGLPDGEYTLIVKNKNGTTDTLHFTVDCDKCD